VHATSASIGAPAAFSGVPPAAPSSASSTHLPAPLPAVALAPPLPAHPPMQQDGAAVLAAAHSMSMQDALHVSAVDRDAVVRALTDPPTNTAGVDALSQMQQQQHQQRHVVDATASTQVAVGLPTLPPEAAEVSSSSMSATHPSSPPPLSGTALLHQQQQQQQHVQQSSMSQASYSYPATPVLLNTAVPASATASFARTHAPSVAAQPPPSMPATPLGPPVFAAHQPHSDHAYAAPADPALAPPPVMPAPSAGDFIAAASPPAPLAAV
jgi:hypothetical protein